MESNSMIDMSLDDIIKLNRRTKKASGSKPSLKARSLAVKRAGLIRSSLVKPMKSRQVTAARAIFQRARRTAAIAARVAADAAALVSPANTVAQSNRRIGAAGPAAARNNRAISRNLAVRQRIMAVNRQIFQRQRRSRGVPGALTRLGVRPQRQVQRQQRLQRPDTIRRLSRNNNSSNTFGIGSQRSFRQNSSLNVIGRQRRVTRVDTQRFGIRRRGGGRMVGAQTNMSAMSSTRYQQYLQQARALIRAQAERVNPTAGGFNSRDNYNRYSRTSSMYVDVPVRSGGGDFTGNRFGGRNGIRGRFRG
ncbi:expressed protein [Echinococcus multilocularis]|uniref:Expressed protein n=1 Tax=Echinococcus multilocularis TaxID=6211 RepID=A0A068Y143_ECHMU|nr:expressed protein [Echinococcus multilocularis]